VLEAEGRAIAQLRQAAEQTGIVQDSGARWDLFQVEGEGPGHPQRIFGVDALDFRSQAVESLVDKVAGVEIAVVADQVDRVEQNAEPGRGIVVEDSPEGPNRVKRGEDKRL